MCACVRVAAVSSDVLANLMQQLMSSLALQTERSPLSPTPTEGSMNQYLREQTAWAQEHEPWWKPMNAMVKEMSVGIRIQQSPPKRGILVIMAVAHRRYAASSSFCLAFALQPRFDEDP
jgi:hypothetical protein